MEHQKEKAIKFAYWLAEMFALNDMGSAEDFSRMCQVSNQSLSRFLLPELMPITRTYQLPKRETLIKIANGLSVPALEALEALGYFSIETGIFAELKPFIALYGQLSGDQKEIVTNNLSDLLIKMQQILEDAP